MNFLGLEIESINYEVKEGFDLNIYFDSTDKYLEFKDVLSGYNSGIVGTKILTIDKTKPNGLVFNLKLKELSKESEDYNRYLIIGELEGKGAAIELLAKSMNVLEIKR